MIAEVSTRFCPTQVPFRTIWEANAERRYIQILIDMWNRGGNQHVATIQYWMERFRAGEESILFLNSRKSMELADGAHRAIALHLLGYDGPVKVQFTGDLR